MRRLFICSVVRGQGNAVVSDYGLVVLSGCGVMFLLLRWRVRKALR
jgi:hypothetical protein